MATLVPVVANDLHNAAFLHAAGDKKSFQKVGNKWAGYAKNPGKSMWDSFTSIFGFGAKRPKRKAKAKPKAKRRPGRPRKK